MVVLQLGVVQNGLSGIDVSRYFSWRFGDRFEDVSGLPG